MTAQPAAYRLLWMISLLLLAGCQPTNTAEFRFNSVELLKQERLTLPIGKSYPAEQSEEIQLIMLALFGTPDQPRLPALQVLGRRNGGSVEVNHVEDPADELTSGATIFQLANLEVAAGPVRSDEAGKSFGLYREHCANCHGLTGDGAGATAGFLNPYPRDFRLGKFKFKSTPLRQAPTHEDLLALSRRGIPGTAMPAFHRLHPEELDVMIDYVRYLSVRGQVERYLISELARLDGETILTRKYEVASGEWSTSELDEIAEDAIQQIGETELSEFFQRWIDADQAITQVPSPLPKLDPANPQHSAFVETGRELYFGKANCAECHGQTASGTVTPYFDDWTSDWIKSNGIYLTKRGSYRDFLKAGALPPRTVRPRNLLQGVMRGGSDVAAIYRKIANGIEGTPMPSSAATLKEEEIWALVAYVRSLGHLDDNK